jgi:hypothetical protein
MNSEQGSDDENQMIFDPVKMAKSIRLKLSDWKNRRHYVKLEHFVTSDGLGRETGSPDATPKVVEPASDGYKGISILPYELSTGQGRDFVHSGRVQVSGFSSNVGLYPIHVASIAACNVYIGLGLESVGDERRSQEDSGSKPLRVSSEMLLDDKSGVELAVPLPPETDP